MKLSAKLHNTIWALLVLLLLPAVLPTATQAQDRQQEIRTMLEQRDQEIKRVLGTSDTFTEAQRDQLRGLINDVIDFREMGRLALGPHWNGLTAEQQAAFAEVFGDVVRAQSLADLDVYRATVTYDAIAVDGDSAFVTTTTVYKDVPTTVEYVLGYRNDGWYVDDMILDNVGTVDGYARSFRTLIRKKGFDHLMTKLRERRDKAMAGT